MFSVASYQQNAVVFVHLQQEFDVQINGTNSLVVALKLVSLKPYQSLYSRVGPMIKIKSWQECAN
jgi:hypothetical protein